jgi:hypothetical protein
VRGVPHKGLKKTSKKLKKPLDKPHTVWYNKGTKKVRDATEEPKPTRAM